MRIDILTLFPKMFSGFLSESLILRAQKKKILEIKVWDLRNFATDSHKTVDDKPYGGGPGMVLKVDVMGKAIKSIKAEMGNKKSKVILLTPQGKTFNQKLAQKLAKNNHLILVCGHYEGFDERIRKFADLEISIGDYVLSGGELASQVVTETVARLVPGFLGKKESLKEESFNENCLEYPQYTRPENYKGKKVPKILLSGDHQKIEEWRKKQAFKKTQKIRPDLLK